MRLLKVIILFIWKVRGNVEIAELNISNNF